MENNKESFLIDTYLVEINNGEYIVIFEESDGTKRKIKVDIDFINELMLRKKEDTKYKNERTRHLEHLHLTDEEVDIRMIENMKSAEDELLEHYGYNRIENEIWKLPYPQNKRAYLKLVQGYSLSEISQIEKTSVTAIKYSIDKALKRLQNIL